MSPARHCGTPSRPPAILRACSAAKQDGRKPGHESIGSGRRQHFRRAIGAFSVAGTLMLGGLRLCGLDEARAISSTPASSPLPAGMVLVPGGTHRPLFRGEKDPRQVTVEAFYLDVTPVTHLEFLEFVRAHPKWRRSQVKRLFADENYLRNWTDDLAFDPRLGRTPVTYVSWFAAKAYAQWKGRRLPGMVEWEYAAAASRTNPDGSGDAEFQRDVLRWYATPTPEALPEVGGGAANYFGVQDLHGLVWEWVSDFNSAMVTGDARGDTGLERQLFCGAGALDTNDRANYTAFMRYGFRSSLKAAYCIHNLGFRCAKDP